MKLFDFVWVAYENPSCGNPWQSIDVVFSVKTEQSSVSADELLNDSDLSSVGFVLSTAADFFLQCVRAAIEKGRGGSSVAKLIVPLTAGQIVRGDIIPLRFIDCEFVESCVSLAEPCRLYPGKPAGGQQMGDLASLLSASAAGLLLQKNPEGLGDVDARSLSPFVEADMENRLSFPWIVEPTPRKTLVIVEGSRVHPDDGGTGPNIYLAAIALGIDMVVLDKPGHWLEGPEYAHWRKDFIQLDLAQPPDAEFAERVVKAVRSYGGEVDGIITFCDSYQAAVACAAHELGLPTSSAEGLAIATNKYETSVFEGRTAHLVSSPQEAIRVAAVQGDSLYPCIIKPCNGWSSEGVFRIDNKSELLPALQSLAALAGSRHGNDFVIERYCSGPEVDANFVLLDGEILFFEVSDDFPKSADVNGFASPRGTQSFIELDTVFPSRLSESEINLLKICFHNTLLRLGLRSGILHLEGRIDNSMVEYRDDNGVLDLHEKNAHDAQAGTPPPAAWLIEINPRPPGMKGTQIIESTWGVDYWGLGLLIAVADKPRARALARPFRNGPQYTCVMVFIPVDYDLASCEGVFASDDVCAELLERRPDLARNISRCGCLVKKGERVAHPSRGVNSFLAYFNVFSRNGRREALRLAREVREEVRFSFV